MKDQMTARHFVLPNDKPANYNDTDFLPIYTGMKALLPACDLIATAAAAINQAHITDANEAVIDLIKDCVNKLQDTKKRANGFLANQWVAPTQVTLDPMLLPLGAPVLWGLATVIPNLGQLPQNPPVAIIPGAPQPQAQQVNLTPPAQVIVAPQGNGGASGSVLPQAVNNAPPVPVAQAQQGNAGVSGSILLPQAVNNAPQLQVVVAQQVNGGSSGSVLPQAVNNAPPASVTQDQQGNDSASGNVLP